MKYMYNALWGKIMLRWNKILFVGTIAGGLCACSVLGKRQESTKKDLDESSIPQMKVVTGKSSATEEDKKEDKIAAFNPKTMVGFETKYIQPNIDAHKYVEEKKINFNQLTEEGTGAQKQKLPDAVDRISLLGGLGGKLFANLKIIEADDDFKQSLGYDEAQADDLRQKLNAQNQGYENATQEVFAAGEAQFNLDDTDLDALAANTVDENGKKMKTFLLDEINKDKKAKDPKASVDVTQVVFKDLPDMIKDSFTASFDPNLKLVRVKVKKHMIVSTTENGKPIAFVFDNGKYQPVAANDITVDADKNLKLVFKRKISRQEMAQTPILVGNDQTMQFEELKFGDKKIPVMTNDYYEEVSTFTLGSELASTKTAETIQTPPPAVPPPPVVSQQEPTPAINEIVATPQVSTSSEPTEKPADGSNPTDQQEQSTVVSKKPDEKTPAATSTTPVIQNQSTLVQKVEVPSYLKPNPEPTLNSSNDKSSASNSRKVPQLTVVKSTPAPPTPPPSLARAPEVEAAFPKTKNKAWFDMRMNGHAKKFYKVGKVNNKDALVYDPGIQNFKFWNDKSYPKSMFTDYQVETACNAYSYSRDTQFSIRLSNPPELANKAYVTYKDVPGAPETIPALSFNEMVFDEYNVPAENGSKQDPDLIRRIVNATFNTPAGMKTQTWRLKICFDPKKDFTAFWTSTETEATEFEYSESNNSVTLTPGNKAHWVQASKSPDVYSPGYPPPDGFNANRKNRIPSSITITCEAGPTECFATFQLKFLRGMRGKALIAYMNQSKITLWGANVTKLVQANFDKQPNRNEIVVYGGIKFDSTKPKLEKQADGAAAYETFIPPPMLRATKGAIKPGTDLFNPDVAAHILFPGENSELYFNVSATGT